MELVCFLCPNGCSLAVTSKELNISVSGNQCKRGQEFAIQEVTCPQRVFTTTVRVAGGVFPLASVRSREMVPKAEFPHLLAALNALCLEAPVESGQIMLPDAAENQVITTMSVPAIPG